MPLNMLDGNTHVRGRLTCDSMTAPTGSVGNDAIVSLAGIEATKVVHQFVQTYDQLPGTAVVNETKGVHAAYASGTLVAVKAAIIGAVATDASRTVDVDVQKSTANAAFATVLSSTLQFTSTSTLRQDEAASINDDSYIAGDLFRIVVTVAGAVGVQAQGLLVTLFFRENPE